jgi:tetratricopeptide (TPR) repeat protein
LGNSLDDQNQPNEAIEAYRRAIQIQPQQPNAYIELAVTLMRQSRFAESAQAFRAAVQIRPDPRSLTGLGRVLFQQGQIEGESGAISAFNQALQIDATYSDAYEGLVGIYRFKIQQEPNRVDNYVVLGDLLYLWNRLDAALTTYDQALAIDPNHATAYNGRGSVFLSRSQIPEAIDQFRKAAELDPNHAYALANLGTAFRLNRQLDRAIASYRQALQADEMGGLPATAHVLAYLGLGLTLKQKGDTEGAIAAFKQALELSPNYEPAQSNLTEMLNPSVANAPEQIPSRRQQPLIGVLRAVVWIKTETLLDGTAFGTGWIVKREGDRAWIVTNRHVIFDRGAGQPAEDVAIMLYSEGEFRRQLPARVVQVSNHEQLDMALLEVSNLPEDIEPLQLSTAPVPIETPIRVIGHPMGEDGTVFPWNSVIGKISGYSAEELRIDATLGGGVSGAPVLDERNNQVLGLTWGGTRLDRGTGGIGSAYPTQYFVEQLRSWGVTE